MGLLLKALKQAETDRKIARVVLQTGQADGARGYADARMAGGEKPHGDIPPIATRARTGEHPRNAPAIALPAHANLWITLALAAVSAAGFGYWMKGMSPMSPPSATAETVRAVTPTPFSTAAPSTIPAALRMHEAGALQLRLDRRVDGVGRDAPPPGNVK